MKGQRYIKFPTEVSAFLTGEYHDPQEMVLPMFRELNKEEEAKFRKHARENYVVGEPIRDEVWHPVWCDEARKMNLEAVEEKEE